MRTLTRLLKAGGQILDAFVLVVLATVWIPFAVCLGLIRLSVMARRA